ncbi:MAG: hypothetical protein AB1489_10830 [Acidobacteriota bacterium]
MSEEWESGANISADIELETIKKDFIAYLNGKVAPLFVAESLSQLLRVEPPIYFEPKQIAELVASWAQVRAVSEGRLVHEYYLKSIELIVTADRTGVLDAFKPANFYMPYFEGLVRQCPASEKELFRERLKQLREHLFKQWGYELRRAEFEETAAVQSSVGVKRQRPIDDINALIAKLRRPDLRLTPLQEQAIITELKSTIEALLQVREPGFSLVPYLEALIGIAINIFNNNQPLFGAELLYVVQQVYNWSGFNEALRESLRTSRSGSELSETQLKQLVDKPELRSALRVFLTHFEDLSPYALLTTLADEPDRQQRRFQISLVEIHGEAAAPIIMNMLSQVNRNSSNWYFTRNLVYLLGRVVPTEVDVQRLAINLIGPFLTAPVFQLRQAALASLECLNNEEVLPLLVQVFNDANYTEEQLDNQERISTYLSNTINVIGKYNCEAACRLLVEIALERRINFIAEKLARPLRLQALQVLATKYSLLSPPLLTQIIDRVRSLTRWRVKLVSRLLGQDEQLLLALLEVVAANPSPPAIEVLQEVRTRYADEVSGRRAQELLEQLQTTR